MMNFDLKFKNGSLSLLLISFCFLYYINTPAQTLKAVAESKGVFIGTIMSNQLLNNTNIENGKPNAIIRDEFNILVLENAMKMNAVLPNRPNNPFSFGAEALNKTSIDKFLKYCKDDVPNAKLRTRGHTMIWHSQAPNWLENEAKNWTSKQIYDFTYQYIKALASYCGNRMDEWDVLNEVLHDGNGNQIGPFRGDAWFSGVANSQSGMDDYFKFCFETAREFAPNAKLYYNDYNIEEYNNSNSSKNGRMRSFVQRLTSANTPIDGVGFQCHFVLTQMASNGTANTGFMNRVEQSMEFIDNHDLEVSITELDIRRCDGNGSNSGHKAAYKAFTQMALSQPNCNSLLVWGISDKDSWVIPWFGCDYALLYDNSFNEKGAYEGVKEALIAISGTSLFTNEIITVSSPTSVVQGETVTLTINYESSGEKELIVMFQLDTDPYSVLAEKRLVINEENKTIAFDIDIPVDAPEATIAYQFQVYLAPVDKGWDDRFDNLAKNNVSITKRNITGIDDNFNAKMELSVFPNPSQQGVFHLATETDYKVLSITGELLLEGKGEDINLEGYPSGTYILQLPDVNARLIK